MERSFRERLYDASFDTKCVNFWVQGHWQNPAIAAVGQNNHATRIAVEM